MLKTMSGSNFDIRYFFVEFQAIQQNSHADLQRNPSVNKRLVFRYSLTLNEKIPNVKI